MFFSLLFGNQGVLNRQPASPETGGSLVAITGLNRESERKQKEQRKIKKKRLKMLSFASFSLIYAL